jgi:hypothetical protein
MVFSSLTFLLLLLPATVPVDAVAPARSRIGRDETSRRMSLL